MPTVCTSSPTVTFKRSFQFLISSHVCVWEWKCVWVSNTQWYVLTELAVKPDTSNPHRTGQTPSLFQSSSFFPSLPQPIPFFLFLISKYHHPHLSCFLLIPRSVCHVVCGFVSCILNVQRSEDRPDYLIHSLFSLPNNTHTHILTLKHSLHMHSILHIQVLLWRQHELVWLVWLASFKRVLATC